MSNSLIKVYKVKSFAHTPFNNDEDLQYLLKKGIILTENIYDADVLISQNLKHLKKYFWKFYNSKKYLVWTLEPRFDINFNSSKKFFFGLINCHFMNVYTKDVFTSNLTYTAHIVNKKLENVSKDYSINNRKIIALMSYYKGVRTPKLIKDGRDIDLIKLRSEIALKGFAMGIVDVIGKGWPIGISNEDSRDGNWFDRKKNLLKPYFFNLCFENTIAKNYMTEKIWDSIENYCLPIYYGKGSTAYELFPKDSFIDYSMFNNPSELFDFIYNISDEEYIDRINKCINIYNSISNNGDNFVKNERKKALDKIVDKLNLIINN